jgi:hypothetical protein
MSIALFKGFRLLKVKTITIREKLQGKVEKKILVAGKRRAQRA